MRKIGGASVWYWAALLVVLWCAFGAGQGFAAVVVAAAFVFGMYAVALWRLLSRWA